MAKKIWGGNIDRVINMRILIDVIDSLGIKRRGAALIAHERYNPFLIGTQQGKNHHGR